MLVYSLTMLMRVATLVFLYLIRLRFPTSKSIPSIIKERYIWMQNIKTKFEKVDFKFKRAKLDLDFLYYPHKKINQCLTDPAN